MILGQDMRLTMVAVAVVSTIAIAGCAGRAPQLVQVVKAEDNGMTCDQIVAELKSNNQRMTDLAKEEGWKVTQNVVAGVAGFVIPVLWIGMDFQDAAGKEGKALSQRNEYLTSLAQKKCGGVPTTTASIAPPSAGK
ncbi:MAG: hypothetical protein K0U74_00670 [Alphaproteobacteria bacterium]|nr:hypothetical protein [Alphaproteobacteria bacterium]